MDSQLLYALADFGYFMNPLSLLPIGMMDGGRITGALSPYAGVVGVGLGEMLIYNGIIQNPIIFLVVMAGGWQTYQRLSNPNAPCNALHSRVDTLGWLGLCSLPWHRTMSLGGRQKCWIKSNLGMKATPNQKDNMHEL